MFPLINMRSFIDGNITLTFTVHRARLRSTGITWSFG